MTGVELTEAEALFVTRLWDRSNNKVGRLAEEKGALEDLIAARLAPVEAERDSALAVAKSMDHFADAAVRCEAKSNEYAAENRRLTALVEAVNAIYAAAKDITDHGAAISADLYGVVDALGTALGGAK